ncbi:MAG: BamA/TamA family outer membrane protein, partial [Gammaproteobacteria bacterium]|nr:BamA/TamA family outer membrane protein [Gammaproteobacteria bacterium]
EWQRNLYLQLTHENTQIAQIRTSDVLLLPGISLSRSRGDTPVQPRSASRISADLRGSLQALGSDTDFIRFKLETRMIRPIGRGRILLRGDIGTSFVSQFSSLPASQRFFAGGDRSVRGYGFNELGSHDAEGRNVGGRHFVATSTEIEWPVAGRWSTAFFVDAGNAFDDFRDELEFSVGLGGRLLTPVGMIRLDIAKPVSEGDQTLRLHIGVGADL